MVKTGDYLRGTPAELILVRIVGNYYRVENLFLSSLFFRLKPEVIYGELVWINNTGITCGDDPRQDSVRVFHK